MQILYLAEGGVGAARATFGNAAASTLYGIDVDFSVRPAPGLTLNGGFELLHAKFDKYDNAVINFPATDGFGGIVQRSEERRVGKECVSTCRSRWWPES